MSINFLRIFWLLLFLFLSTKNREDTVRAEYNNNNCYFLCSSFGEIIIVRIYIHWVIHIGLKHFKGKFCWY